jgi:phage terminase large subunit GpA-like protein
MPIKGASTPGREIYSRPAPIDLNRANTKAAKRGLQVYQVGTEKAKDLIIDARLRLDGAGPGRFHFYKGVRPDYFEQLLSEVKVPSRAKRGVKVWQPKKGVRNEALDAEIYALHAARSQKVHLFREETWASIERRVKQLQLLETPERPEKSEQEASAAPNKAPTAPPKPNQPSNFATRWGG